MKNERFLVDLLEDISNERPWRSDAAKEMGWYDGNQLTQDQIELLQSRGMPPVIRNLIAPTINVVIGMEARSRQDFRVLADEIADSDLARALNQRVHEAERMSGLDDATAKAYKGQVSVGLDWVEIRKNTDPFGPSIKASYIHRNQIHWDWRSRENDLSDARWVVRNKWTDLDIVMARWPGKRGTLARLGGDSFAEWDSEERLTGGGDEWEWGGLGETLAHSTWLDEARSRVKLYEVWYRKWRNATFAVSRVGPKRVVEVKKSDPRVEMLVEQGMVSLVDHVIPDMRVSFWCGPLQLSDEPATYPYQGFPYAPSASAAVRSGMDAMGIEIVVPSSEKLAIQALGATETAMCAYSWWLVNGNRPRSSGIGCGPAPCALERHRPNPAFVVAKSAMAFSMASWRSRRCWFSSRSSCSSRMMLSQGVDSVTLISSTPRCADRLRQELRPA